MRHRKRSVEKNVPSKPLAVSLLDLTVEFLCSHMMRNFPFELYSISIGIIQRILSYQKRTRTRLSYSWKPLWNGSTRNLALFSSKRFSFFSFDRSTEIPAELRVSTLETPRSVQSGLENYKYFQFVHHVRRHFSQITGSIRRSFLRDCSMSSRFRQSLRFRMSVRDERQRIQRFVDETDDQSDQHQIDHQSLQFQARRFLQQPKQSADRESSLRRHSE